MLFEKISSDNSFTKTLLECIQESGSSQSEFGNQQVNINTSRDAQEHPEDDESSMAAHMCHTKEIDKRDAHELPLRVNPMPP